MNAGRIILLLLGLIAGIFFMLGAIHAVITGNFKSPQKIVYGTPSGIEFINRKERPAAFWFCTISYFCFGLAIFFCLWIIA